MHDDELAMSISTKSENVQALENRVPKVTTRTNVLAKVTIEDEEGAYHQQSLAGRRLPNPTLHHRYIIDMAPAYGSTIREFPVRT